MGAKNILGEVKDLTLFLVEISKLTLKAKHPDLKVPVCDGDNLFFLPNSRLQVGGGKAYPRISRIC